METSDRLRLPSGVGCRAVLRHVKPDDVTEHPRSRADVVLPRRRSIVLACRRLERHEPDRRDAETSKSRRRAGPVKSPIPSLYASMKASTERQLMAAFLYRRSSIVAPLLVRGPNGVCRRLFRHLPFFAAPDESRQMAHLSLLKAASRLGRLTLIPTVRILDIQ